jgi:CDP-diglyceride synthetase
MPVIETTEPKSIAALPLLGSEISRRKVAEVLIRETDLQEEEAILYVGHGSKQDESAVYEGLEKELHASGQTAAIVGTLESIDQVLTRINTRKVTVAPLLLTSGKHALQDICGEGKESVVSRLRAGGREVCFIEKGLVEYAVQKKNYFLSICGSCGVTLMLAVPLFFTALVYLYEPFLFLFLVLVTKAMDTGGYIFGELSSLLMGGNHKICPSFSPKKSWEGTIGGLIFSVGVSLLFYNYDPVDFGSDPVSGTCFSIYIYIILGIMLGLGSFAGDLTESAVKRICGVKDSNNIIPGMGGAFDVLDSFIYNGILFIFSIFFIIITS